MDFNVLINTSLGELKSIYGGFAPISRGGNNKTFDEMVAEYMNNNGDDVLVDEDTNEFDFNQIENNDNLDFDDQELGSDDQEKDNEIDDNEIVPNEFEDDADWENTNDDLDFVEDNDQELDFDDQELGSEETKTFGGVEKILNIRMDDYSF